MENNQRENIMNEWYEFWVNQATSFYEMANEHLGEFFSGDRKKHPEDFSETITAWLEAMHAQWRIMPEQIKHKQHKAYWEHMIQLYQQASELMLKEWIKRADSNNPIMTIQELYELWLSCCQEAYQASLHSRAYQKAYGDFIKSTMKFWENMN